MTSTLLPPFSATSNNDGEYGRDYFLYHCDGSCKNQSSEGKS